MLILQKSIPLRYEQAGTLKETSETGRGLQARRSGNLVECRRSSSTAISEGRDIGEIVRRPLLCTTELCIWQNSSRRTRTLARLLKRCPIFSHLTERLQCLGCCLLYTSDAADE